MCNFEEVSFQLRWFYDNDLCDTEAAWVEALKGIWKRQLDNFEYYGAHYVGSELYPLSYRAGCTIYDIRVLPGGYTTSSWCAYNKVNVVASVVETELKMACLAMPGNEYEVQYLSIMLDNMYGMVDAAIPLFLY